MNSDVGSFWVNISASDGRGGSTWLYFIVNVQNTNDDPIILTDDITIALEDSTYTIDYEALDVDPTNDIMKWSIHTNAVWLNIGSDSGILSGTPTNDDIGDFFVNISVSDGKGGIDWSNFTITVENSNDMPEWTVIIEDIKIEGKETISIEVNVTDDDLGDEIVYTISTDPSSTLTIGPYTGIITWDEGISGTYLVNVSASDGTDTIYQEFSVEFPSENDSEGIPLIPIILAAVILLLILVLFFFLVKRKKDEIQEDPRKIEETKGSLMNEEDSHGVNQIMAEIHEISQDD
jgi:hypothetical protein